MSLKFSKSGRPAFRLPHAPTISGSSEPYTERCAEPPQPAPEGASAINMHKAMAGATPPPAAAMWEPGGRTTAPGAKHLNPKSPKRIASRKLTPGLKLK